MTKKQALCIALTAIATSMTGCATFWEYEDPLKELKEYGEQVKVFNQQVKDYNQLAKETPFLAGLFGTWETLEKKRKETNSKRKGRNSASKTKN